MLRTTFRHCYPRATEGRRPLAPKRAAGITVSVAGKSAPQFALDLAVDALEFGGKIPHQHLQAPLAIVDDAPQFGALIGGQSLVGKPDSGLDDFAPPQLRASVDEFDSSVWHALIPRRAASGPTMPQRG